MKLLLIFFLLLSYFFNYSYPQFYDEKNLVIALNNENIFYKTNVLTTREYSSLIENVVDENDSDIDLIIDFEDRNKSYKNYSIIYQNFEENNNTFVNGKKSGKFYKGDNYIALMPQKQSLFEAGQICGSFTIEFYTYFYQDYDYQIIFQYSGRNLSDRYDKKDYGINIYTKNGTIYYEFLNFFWDSQGNSYSYVIEEKEKFKTYTWEHHAITFNIIDGKLAVYKNNLEQDIKWITRTGKPMSQIFSPMIKKNLNFSLVIGKNAYFSLDNFKISKKSVNEFNLNKYVNNKGEIITKVFKISETLSEIKKITLNIENEIYNHYNIAYRVSDDVFFPDNTELEWIFIKNGTTVLPETKKMGKYIQFKIVLYPYLDNNTDIILRNITLDYRRDKEPGIVFIKDVEAGDGRIKVRWISVPEPDIKGYLLYYGRASQFYICKDAIEGHSPVFIPANNKTIMEFELSNLLNEQIYFLSIRAVDKNNHLGPYSKEYFAIPGIINNSNPYKVVK